MIHFFIFSMILLSSFSISFARKGFFGAIVDFFSGYESDSPSNSGNSNNVKSQNQNDALSRLVNQAENFSTELGNIKSKMEQVDDELKGVQVKGIYINGTNATDIVNQVRQSDLAKALRVAWNSSDDMEHLKDNFQKYLDSLKSLQSSFESPHNFFKSLGSLFGINSDSISSQTDGQATQTQQNPEGNNGNGDNENTDNNPFGSSISKMLEFFQSKDTNNAFESFKNILHSFDSSGQSDDRRKKRST